ncbi:MAG: outer membrane beta-barrel protein [Salinivirgaceae bacterium]|jgi:hypothetical protein|nr:outer membrane beta-barrel protein [Salinivirgaceae bacterium]
MKKKIFLVFFSLLFFSILYLNAQEKHDNSIDSRYELSIVIDDLFGKQTYSSYPYYEPYYLKYSSSIAVIPINVNIPKIGLGYKYHFDKSAIRSKLSFGSSNITNNNVNDSSKSENSITVLGITVGYEFNKTFDKVVIFYGLDVSMKVNNINYESSYTYENEVYTNKSAQQYNAFGISPLLGVKYFITPKLSVSTEIKYVIESFESKETNKLSGSDIERKTEGSGTNTYLGPIGQISINVHF